MQLEKILRVMHRYEQIKDALENKRTEYTTHFDSHISINGVSVQINTDYNLYRRMMDTLQSESVVAVTEENVRALAEVIKKQALTEEVRGYAAGLLLAPEGVPLAMQCLALLTNMNNKSTTEHGYITRGTLLAYYLRHREEINELRKQGKLH